ncbi:restriction endonuclease subunit S [Legionella pneumophila]
MNYDLLENLCELIIDCPHSTPKWTDSGIYVIRNQNIVNNRLDLSNPSFTDEYNYLLRTKRVVPKENDIILTREAPMGRVCLIPPGLKICQGQRQVLLRGKENINPKYLYYALQSSFVKEQIFWNENTGSTVSNIRIPVIKKFKIPRLPDSENKIAHILSTLDDKIELNKKINQTLESIAQTIFKSWFVDFDPVHAKANASSEDEYDTIAKELGISREILDLFPSEFEESELGLIPKGWSVESFAKLASMKTKSIKPYEYPEKVWMSYSIPAFDSNCYPEFCLGSEIKSNKYKVENGAILVSKLNPTTPRIWLSHKKNNNAICSTEFMQFLPKNMENRSYIYCLINSEYFQNEIKSRVTGTTGSRQRAQPKEVAVIPVINPPSNLVDRFSIITCQLLQQTLSNREENNNLKKLQQLLLPKLLSGEIDVSNLYLEPEHD